MKDDLITQQHAHVFAFDDNLAPYDNLKCERAITKGTDINSLWLAKGDGSVRCFVQYHSTDLENIDGEEVL